MEEQQLINNYMGLTVQSHPLLEHLNNVDYKHNWANLMPVIIKISHFKFEDGETAYPITFGMLNEETENPMFRFNRMPLHEAETLIKAAYEACIEWITSFN